MAQRNDTWLWRERERPPLIVAHRGASADAPENTLAAFRLALDAGAPAVECDVHLSADGVPVVIHDARVDRTTGGSGDVGRLSLAELQALDAGAWFGAAYAGERIPTLEEALSLCAGRARLFVELKAGGGDALARAALDAIGGAAVAVISFDADLVRIVSRHRPDLATGFLFGTAYLKSHSADDAIATALGAGASFLSPQATAVDGDLVQRAHDARLPVSVWTVDEEAEMRRLAELGADAITTNRPAAALAALAP